MTQEQIEKYRMSLFVDYDLAVELKNKGFDMPCLGFYYSLRFWFNDGFEDGSNQDDYSINSELDKYTFAAPLIDQVIEWLIEKYNIYVYTQKNGLGNDYYTFVFGKNIPQPNQLPCNSRLQALVIGIKYALNYI